MQKVLKYFKFSYQKSTQNWSYKTAKKANFWSKNSKIWFFLWFSIQNFPPNWVQKIIKVEFLDKKKSMILTFASLGLASEAFHAHLLINDISTNIFQRSARFLKKKSDRESRRERPIKKGEKLSWKSRVIPKGELLADIHFFCCEGDKKKVGKFFEIRVIHISVLTERKF